MKEIIRLRGSELKALAALTSPDPTRQNLQRIRIEKTPEYTYCIATNGHVLGVLRRKPEADPPFEGIAVLNTVDDVGAWEITTFCNNKPLKSSEYGDSAVWYSLCSDPTGKVVLVELLQRMGGDAGKRFYLPESMMTATPWVDWRSLLPRDGSPFPMEAVGLNPEYIQLISKFLNAVEDHRKGSPLTFAQTAKDSLIVVQGNSCSDRAQAMAFIMPIRVPKDNDPLGLEFCKSARESRFVSDPEKEETHVEEAV